MTSTHSGQFPPAPAPGYKPYPEMVKALFKDMNNDSSNMMHAAIGIAGEASELIVAVANNDRENIIEEAGDAYFYIQALLNNYAWNPLYFPMPDEEPSISDRPEINFSVAAGNVLDIIKKYWVYEKPVDLVVLHGAMGRVIFHYLDLLHEHELSFEGVLEYNQIKLGKRYPDGVYSNNAAVVRADKEDLSHLDLNPSTQNG